MNALTIKNVARARQRVPYETFLPQNVARRLSVNCKSDVRFCSSCEISFLLLTNPSDDAIIFKEF